MTQQTSIPTVAVTARVYTQDGLPVHKASVAMRLSTTERYGGYIVPREVTAETNANGVAVLRVWPNALGTESSEYRVSIRVPEASGSRSVSGYAVVPNTDCDIADIMELPAYDARSSSTIITDEVAGYAAQASAARDTTQSLYQATVTISQNAKASEMASDQNKQIAETFAGLAGEQAAIAANSATAAINTSNNFATEVVGRVQTEATLLTNAAVVRIQSAETLALGQIESNATQAKLNAVGAVVTAQTSAVNTIAQVGSQQVLVIKTESARLLGEFVEEAELYKADFTQLTETATAMAQQARCYANKARVSSEAAEASAVRAEDIVDNYELRVDELTASFMAIESTTNEYKNITLAAKDETIAAKDITIATKDSAIAGITTLYESSLLNMQGQEQASLENIIVQEGISTNAVISVGLTQSANATSQANRAQTEADRAKTEADRAASTVAIDVATQTRLGIVKIGTGINVTAQGEISVTSVNNASKTVAGIVKIGNNIEVDSNGLISLDPDKVSLTENNLTLPTAYWYQNTSITISVNKPVSNITQTFIMATSGVAVVRDFTIAMPANGIINPLARYELQAHLKDLQIGTAYTVSAKWYLGNATTGTLISEGSRDYTPVYQNVFLGVPAVVNYIKTNTPYLSGATFTLRVSLTRTGGTSHTVTMESTPTQTTMWIRNPETITSTDVLDCDGTVLMSQSQKNRQYDALKLIQTTASVVANTYTVNITDYKLVAGNIATIKFNSANTIVAPTLNINSLGAKTIKRRGRALIVNEILANTDAIVAYDGTDFQLFAIESPVATAATATADGTFGTVVLAASNNVTSLDKSATPAGVAAQITARAATAATAIANGTTAGIVTLAASNNNSALNLAATPAGVAAQITAATPTPTARTISTTAPLTGGGDLSANRTLAISAATTATTVADGAAGSAIYAADSDSTSRNKASTPAGTEARITARAATAATAIANGTTAGIVTLAASNDVASLDKSATPGGVAAQITARAATAATASANGTTAGIVTLAASNNNSALNLAATPAGVAAQITAATPTPTARTISTTAPLTGGGDLTTNRTFAISAATTATTVADGSAGSAIYAADSDSTSRNKASTPAGTEARITIRAGATTVNTNITTTWAGASPPYTQSITVAGVTATSIVDVTVANNVTLAQFEEYQALNWSQGPQSANTIQLRAFGYKNIATIPITVVVRGA